MKKLILFASAVMLSAGLFAQAQDSVKKAENVVKFKELTYDFGKIKQGSPVTHDFVFTNISNSPVIIESAVPSCGCTTPEWSRDAIPAGATAQIKVGYNAYSEGSFTKTVTIVYNTNQTKMLTISGEVYKVPQTSAPENSSVQLLKQVN